jgi:hypothetical protein
VYILTIGYVIATVLYGVFFGIAVNFGLSGFVSILKGIKLGIETIPSNFDIIGRKVASICEAIYFLIWYLVQRIALSHIQTFFLK